MINCVNLNLDINPLREGLDINSYGTDKQHIKVSLNDINHDLILLLASLNLTGVWAEVFYTPPGQVTKIHVDDAGGDYTKLNYVFGGKDSLMYWWQQKTGVSNVAEDTEIDSQYTIYKTTDVDLIDQRSVKFPSLVQVGIPHNIENFEEPRYCLSLVLIKQYNRLTMAESIEIFKQYLQ